MLIRRPDDLPASAITPESVYLNRRAFMGAAGALALGAVAAPARALGGAAGGAGQEDTVTSEEDATSYNNYYEFGTAKDEPRELAADFKPRPWTVTIEGMVKTPRRVDLDQLLAGLAVEDRTYRHRCVEAWSMVIPWRGVALKDVVARCEPLPGAKFVQFTTLYDPKRMPGQRRAVLPWPYKEALRLDEAQHPLAMLATGMYGKTLPNQNGAPLRLVVPWKYGFKANVNPAVDHPRWSQARERRIGEFLRRATLPFNGYAAQVASLYAGMDLRRYY